MDIEILFMVAGTNLIILQKKQVSLLSFRPTGEILIVPTG